MDAFENQILIKPEPDEDFYVFYSKLHFLPMEWGSRSDYEDIEHLGEDFERADKYGSSSRPDAVFHWGEQTLEIRGGWALGIAPESAVAATVDIADLRELCESDVGAGFTVLPRSIKWFYAKERVDPPKLKVLIPKKQQGGDSLWGWVVATVITVPVFLGSIGAFLSSSALTTTNDWWGTNGGSLAGMGFILLFVAFAVGGTVSTIRERRAQERAKLAWLEARRALPPVKNTGIARRGSSYGKKAPGPNRQKPSAAVNDEEEDLFGIGPRNWAALWGLGGFVLLFSLFPLFSLLPSFTGQALPDANVMFGSATMLAFSVGLASVIPHAFVSNDGTIPSLTDERYSVALFWYLVVTMVVCALLLALAPARDLFDENALNRVIQELRYPSWNSVPLWLGALAYWAGSAVLFFFIVRGAWRRFTRPIPFRSYRGARRR